MRDLACRELGSIWIVVAMMGLAACSGGSDSSGVDQLAADQRSEETSGDLHLDTTPPDQRTDPSDLRELNQGDASDGLSPDLDVQAEDTETDSTKDAADLADLPDVPPAEPLLLMGAIFPTSAVGEPLSLQPETKGGVLPIVSIQLATAERAPFDTLGALPPGVVLDSATGAISGTPTQEGVFYFVLEATDSAGQKARELFGLRIGDPSSEGPMLQRARHYQEIYELRHLWHGYSYGNFRPDDPDGDYQLSCHGDATFVSGNCTMAAAYRYAVEKSPEALDIVTQQVNGLRFFQRLTGVPGLIGRSFAHVSDPSDDNQWVDFSEGSNRYEGTGEFEGWRWQGDVSRDQASGAILGIAAAYEFVDDSAVRDTIVEFLTAFADHVWDNGLDFVDPDGQPTKYGNVDGEILEGWPLPNGLNAVTALAWFKIAWVATQEERFKQYYDELAFDRDYIGIIGENMWVYSGYATKWYNTYIAWENFFHLMRLEDDPAQRETLANLFDQTLWSIPGDPVENHKGIGEWNPVKTTWYLFSTGRHDPESLYRALWMVEQFPDAPLRDKKVQNSLDPSIEVDSTHPEFSKYPIPPSKRIPDMVIWHRGPFGLDGGEDSGEERTGCDYMLPYWMGRYYGFIDASW